MVFVNFINSDKLDIKFIIVVFLLFLFFYFNLKLIDNLLKIFCIIIVIILVYKFFVNININIDSDILPNNLKQKIKTYYNNISDNINIYKNSKNNNANDNINNNNIYSIENFNNKIYNNQIDNNKVDNEIYNNQTNTKADNKIDNKIDNEIYNNPNIELKNINDINDIIDNDKNNLHIHDLNNITQKIGDDYVLINKLEENNLKQDLLKKNKYIYSNNTFNNPFLNKAFKNLDVEKNNFIYDKNILDEINVNFYDNLHLDYSDIWEVKNSQRQFYSLPNKGIPDTTKFANSLFYMPDNRNCKMTQLDCYKYENPKRTF